MNSVYVFPGQGSQRRGMGAGLFERFPELEAAASACLGYSLAELCLDDPRRVLDRTEYTQPALYAVGALTYLDRLRGGEPAPAVVAGHSLGEYCALFAAGAFDFVTGLRLVQHRGALMSRAPRGAMAAVVNLELERVRELLVGAALPAVDIANINSRKQCILSGAYDELNAPALREAVTAAGGSFVPLNVSAAFHSRCMAGVQDEFARFLATFTLAPLQRTVIANCTARPYPVTGYAELLARQIASPVRWYESMSWLIHHGHRTFQEIGPGNVLTRLGDKILAEPMAIAPEPAAPVASPASGSAPVAVATSVASPAPARRARPRLVFMYGGQGTQYVQMGRQLYDTSPAFRAAFDRCSAAYQGLSGLSLTEVVYPPAGRPARGGALDDISYSHAALYSIGYSLTEVLRAEGIEPDAVLGHSLGEYVAATVAGAMTFDEGLAAVAAQARMIRERCAGGLLSVLAPPAVFDQRRDVFDGLALAGVNFAGNFVVSGEPARLTAAQDALDRLGHVAIRLAVRHGFHGRLVDPIRDEFVAHASRIRPRPPRVPIYSACYARALPPATLERWAGYLWDVVREPIRFAELMAHAFDAPEDLYFVDLSASGSFANFLKHGYGAAFRCAPVINQFGHNAATLDRVRRELRADGGATDLPHPRAHRASEDTLRA